MGNASDYTDSNTAAELRHNSGAPSYMDQAATYFDDEALNFFLIHEVLDKFLDEASKDNQRHQISLAYELALKDIFQHYIQHETAPDWIEPLIDKCCKERFG